ncbi:MAG TPA: HD-GYP domain-containing protein [Vicinamibacterales bacterium]|nr:HD-GYP domain-containing protein [Vicinamibacterales bacterium]
MTLTEKRLEDELQRRHEAVTCAFLQMLDLRDFETGVHSTRLAEWAIKVAQRLDVPDEDLANIETAALLHDIGKVGVTDAILRKDGPLTAEEIVAMRRHAEFGWSILRGLPGFEAAALYVLHHHERVDGGGYPAGLAGDRIPIGARIVAVIDAFDAMVSDRCYRAGLPVDEAFFRLRDAAGTQFDKDIVREFIEVVRAEGATPLLPGVAGRLNP